MLNDQDFIRLSLENNLFWARIMKEHAIFIESSMPPPQAQLAAQADQFKQQFDRILAETIRLANGIVSVRALQSGQYFTRFTEAAEQATQKLTGIEINSNLTKAEYNIQPTGSYPPTQPTAQNIFSLNQYVLEQINAFAKFKSDLYNMQASCRIFTFLYTSIYEHVFHEARKYMEILSWLQKRDDNYNKDFEAFWNQHMSDHAKVMRGWFDPTEAEHFNKADGFAKTFDAIIQQRNADRAEELAATRELSEFKASTTQEILECKVKSLMAPLFTDHILREALYYIYLLQS